MKRIHTLIAAVLAGPLVATTVMAQGLPTVAASEVGLSDERLGRLAEVVQGYVDPKEHLLGILLTQMFPSGSDIQERFRIMAYQSIVDSE